MKTQFVATALTIALTNIASAQKPPAPEKNDKIVDELLANESLVKKYGTVGYPLADELDPGYECKKSTTLYDFSFPLYSQSVVGIPFNVGVGGEVRLISDTQKIAAELELGPQAQLFNKTERPIDVTFSAATYSNNASTLTYAVHGFGYTLAGGTIAQTMQPIADNASFGYSLPGVLTQSIGGTYGCSFGCDTWGWEAHANLVAHVGGVLQFKASKDGIEAHALASAVAWADVGGSAWAQNGDIKPTISVEGRIDVLRLLYGGRAMMLPQSSGGWVADAASSLSLTKLMGAYVAVDVPIIGTEKLIDLTPREYLKEAQFNCRFTNKLDPKSPPKKS